MNKKVAVIGLGTMGSMALWQLAKEGVDVTGFEQFGIGHDRSAVGGESRLFRTAYLEGPEYVPLLRRSHELWRELEKDTKQNLLSLVGNLTIGKKSSDYVVNVLKSIDDFAIEHEVYDVDDAKKLYPQHKFAADDVVILDKEAGYLRPELAVVSAVHKAQELGAKIKRHTKIKAIEHKSDHVVLTTKDQTYTFDEVIVAAGPWLRELLPTYNEFIQPRAIIMSWFIPESLADVQADVFPTFIRTIDEYDYFGLPTIDQSMIKIALSGYEPDVENLEQLNLVDKYKDIERASHVVKTYFNNIHPDPVRLSVHMDAYSPDEHPFVGRLDDKQNIIVLGGYSGHGFKLAPVMGEIARDFVIDNKTSHQIDHLKPLRFNELK